MLIFLIIFIHFFVYSRHLTSLCLILYQYYAVLITVAVSITSNQRWWCLQQFFDFQDYFSYLEYFWLACYFWDENFSIFVKNCIRILVWISLNLFIFFCRMSTFTALILLVYEHRVSFHHVISSPIFFLPCLKVLVI